MISRREFVQIAAAVAAIAPAGWSRSFAQQRLTQADLLKFDAVGNVTLLHITDIHGQLLPVYFREPSVNLGVGDVKGLVPHLTGRALLEHYKIPVGSSAAYALSAEDFAHQVLASAETLRRAFLRVLGVGPAEYRSRFRSARVA